MLIECIDIISPARQQVEAIRTGRIIVVPIVTPPFSRIGSKSYASYLYIVAVLLLVLKVRRCGQGVKRGNSPHLAYQFISSDIGSK